MAKPEVEKISRTKLMGLLTTLKGNAFVGVMATTEPKMRKTGNPLFGNVKKTRSLSGCLKYDYEGNVNAQREREGKVGNFVVQASAWGTRVGDTCLYVHQPKGSNVDKFYLDLRVLRTIRARFFTIDSGKRLAYADVEPFIYKSKSGKQNLKKEIVINRFAIDNLRRVNIGIPDSNGKIQKRRFIVVDDE
jgi:hypothetical protein